MKLALAAVLGCGTALLAGCADQPGRAAVPPRLAAASGQCFFYNDIRRTTVSPETRAIYVNVAGRDVFEVSVRNYCLRGADPNDPLLVRRRGGRESVCGWSDLDVAVQSVGGVRQCSLGQIRRLTPAEVAALPPRVRP